MVDYTMALNQTALGRVVCWIAQRDVLETPTVLSIAVGIFTSSSSLSLDMGISKAELHSIDTGMDLIFPVISGKLKSFCQQ